MPLLSIRDLSVRFGGLQVLDGVSLEVPEGQIVGLIGPNGAGKTTVFNVISGFVTPVSGSIEWRDESRRPAPHDLVGLGIARTLQGVGLFDSMSVLDNVLIGAHKDSRSGVAAGLLSAPWMLSRDVELRERAMQLLTELGLADAASRPVSSLPYPVRKQVGLARALICDPKLVMLDEPAGGIGQSDIAALSELLRSWIPRRSVLVVEHHMDFVMSTCDFIYVLDAGRIIAAGVPSAIQQDPAVRAAYLGQV